MGEARGGPTTGSEPASSCRFNSLADLLSVPGLNRNTVRQLVDHVTLTPGNELAGRLNVNTASLQALEAVPNVTEEIAQQIIERRESEGDFQSLGDLIDVSVEAFRALADRAGRSRRVPRRHPRGRIPGGHLRPLGWARGPRRRRCEPTTGIAPFGRLVDQVLAEEPYRSGERRHNGEKREHEEARHDSSVPGSTTAALPRASSTSAPLPV